MKQVTIDGQLKVKIVDEDLFAFSDVDFGLVFEELNVGVSDFELFVGFEDKAKELFFDDGFGQLTVVLGLPMPGIGVPD